MVENPEALGFHQKEKSTPRFKRKQEHQNWFCIKLYIILVPNFASFFFLCGFRNVTSKKPYFKSRKLLQISVTKFRIIDVILMCLEILLNKHNTVIKVPGIVKQTVNRK